MALKGLVIDQPWIGMILRGEKTWEMRSRGTNIRGRIALIEKGSGTIVGTAHLVESLPSLRADQMSAEFTKHRIPDAMIEGPTFKWLTPWVLSDIRKLSRPVRYEHPSGAVTWVNLSSGEEARVLGAGDAVDSGAAFSSSLDGTERSLARKVVSQINEQAGIGIPANASTSVKRRGNNLYIDVRWDDGQPRRKTSKFAVWRDRIGIFGLGASVFCTFGLMIHLPLAVLFSGVTIIGALKWVPALFVSMGLAYAGGRGDDLHDLFGNS